MTSPSNPEIALPPSSIEKTYSELIQKLTCTCAAGSYIKSSPVPSATINMGDIIAVQMAILSGFTAGYSIVVVAIRMISCIIDVLCALMNPFSLIFAIIRLFGTCLPDFILIFPQFAIPAKIICYIKILLAVFDYVLNVILPIIEDIIENINLLEEAITKVNKDAQLAIGFKIASLFKELFNILGIFVIFIPLYQMIKVLLSSGASLPCGGGGGSCSDCGDDGYCPDYLQQETHTGTDGRIETVYEDDNNYSIYFSSLSQKSGFISIKDFFPRGLDYTTLDEDDFPYSLTVSGNKYGVVSISDDGVLKLFQVIPDFVKDGYLVDTMIGGIIPVENKYIRFGTPTGNFSTISKITINDGDEDSKNNGTWDIHQVINTKNILLYRDDDESWAPAISVSWRMTPTAPGNLINKSFEFKINHTELVRHNLIGVGCHPAVKAEKEALKNRFSDVANNQDPGLGLPELPDLESFINDVTSCVTNVVPIDVGYEYILENYEDIKNKIPEMANCIENNINSFKDETITYGKQIYPRLFNPETSLFTATPLIQLVGRNVNISLIAYDRYGDILGSGFPEDVVNAEILASDGYLSNITTVLDDTGTPTGEYTAILTSDKPKTIILTAKVADIYVSYFDSDTGTLIPKEIEVQFIETSDMQRREGVVIGEASSEPLGAVGAE